MNERQPGQPELSLPVRGKYGNETKGKVYRRNSRSSPGNEQVVDLVIEGLRPGPLVMLGFTPLKTAV